MTHSKRLTEADREVLRGQLRGSLLGPGHAEYETSRQGWNALVDRRPGAIVRCREVGDVIASVNFARDNGFVLAVRSGGHDYAGNSVCDDGIVIDLSAMQEVRIDAGAKRAQVQAGATWGAFDHEAQLFGLATPGGTVSTVGVAGSTLGGGTGYLTPKHGLATDNLVAADVITADGRLRRASEGENADLFWALRGGGGNFGVVTSFEFRLHEVGPELLAGQIVHRFEAAGEVLRFYRAFMEGAPDGLQCYPFFLRLPPLSVFPEELHGKIAFDLVLAYAGPVEEATEVVRPLREFGDPVFEGVSPQQYTEVQKAFDAGMPKGTRRYSKACYLNGLPDEAIDLILDHVAAMPGPLSVAYLESVHGAPARVEATATAFPHRSAAFGMHIFPGWSDPALDGEAMVWAREFHAAMVPFSTGGAYVNLLAPNADLHDVRGAYGPNFERLVHVKRAYDPENLFRMNHNIPPGSDGP